jgi:hypothetical protein
VDGDRYFQKASGLLKICILDDTSHAESDDNTFLSKIRRFRVELSVYLKGYPKVLLSIECIMYVHTYVDKCMEMWGGVLRQRFLIRELFPREKCTYLFALLNRALSMSYVIMKIYFGKWYFNGDIRN